jgi:hypothetical protein
MPKTRSRQHRDDEARALNLMGGTPGRALLAKPMPLEAIFKAQEKQRKDRWKEMMKYSGTILAPLHKIISADEAAGTRSKGAAEASTDAPDQAAETHAR